MKKNILAIAILAAVVANIILTAVLIFSVVPSANRSNELVKKICTILDLELENPQASDFIEVPYASRIPYVMFEKEAVTLKKGEGETKTRYALVTFTLILNKDSKQYSAASSNIENSKASLNNKLKELISAYTADDIENVDIKKKIKNTITDTCKSYFESTDVVVEAVIDYTLQ